MPKNLYKKLAKEHRKLTKKVERLDFFLSGVELGEEKVANDHLALLYTQSTIMKCYMNILTARMLLLESDKKA